MAEVSEKTFELSVVTPEGAAFEGEAQMVSCPAPRGRSACCPGMRPLVAMLKAGETRIRAQNEWTAFATGPGYFKVQRDRAIVLVDDAVRAEDIDVEQAAREAEEARALLERAEAGEEGIDRWLARSGSGTPRTRSQSPVGPDGPARLLNLSVEEFAFTSRKHRCVAKVNGASTR